MKNQNSYVTETGSPWGTLVIAASDKGLQLVKWGEIVSGKHRADTSKVDASEHPVLAAAEEQLQEYFSGVRRQFDLPLDLHGTEFQVQAWLALAEIPLGTTSTYSGHAIRLGWPAAVRAVGAANGRNPVAIVLPCHRVVGKDGTLTGYAGGLEIKRALLEHEQAVVRQGVRQD